MTANRFGITFDEPADEEERERFIAGRRRISLRFRLDASLLKAEAAELDAKADLYEEAARSIDPRFPD